MASKSATTLRFLLSDRPAAASSKRFRCSCSPVARNHRAGREWRRGPGRGAEMRNPEPVTLAACNIMHHQMLVTLGQPIRHAGDAVGLVNQKNPGVGGDVPPEKSASRHVNLVVLQTVFMGEMSFLILIIGIKRIIIHFPCLVKKLFAIFGLKLPKPCLPIYNSVNAQSCMIIVTNIPF